jgi:hypothetical protein
MTWPYRRCSFALFFAVVGLAALGCSESGDELPRESVSGTVTLDGQPLADGAIQFSPIAGGTGPTPTISGGATIQDGRFAVPRETGLVPGNYKVAINASAGTPKALTKMAPTPKVPLILKELIPAKFNARSELTAEIKTGGSDNLKFELQSEPLGQAETPVRRSR